LVLFRLATNFIGLPTSWSLSLARLSKNRGRDKKPRSRTRPLYSGTKGRRKKRIRHDKSAYKNRNVIERCFGRLKDFRHIATRYDKLAGNFFSALCLVAIVAYWL
jgi:transposase